MAVEVTPEIDITRLQPHSRNVEIYGAEDVTKLVEYIRDSRWIKPLVISQHNRIISGHRRWQAALILGYARVPYVKQYFETEEDELKALLLENASRDKNPEQKVNEANAWTELEEDKSKKRMAEGANSTNNLLDRVSVDTGCENFHTPSDKGRTNDKLAERVGFGSGRTYESAAKVVKTAKQLKEEGKTQEGQALLKVLNEQSVNAATRVLSMPEPQKEAVLQTIASGKASTVKQAEAVIEQEAPPSEVDEEDDDGDEWSHRYDEEHDAYCKYCYKTHRKWRLDEDAWLCEYCYHRTADEFMQIEDVEMSEPQKDFYRRQGVPAALLTSETNEWFTPPQYVDMTRELMRAIDLDPASNAYANEKVVHAAEYFDIQTNGLDKEWHGRVWLNPPYGRDEGGSNQEAWSRRLIEQFEAGITKEAVLLVNSNTEAKWFQPLYDYTICFTNHRIRFYNTEGTPSQPTQGNAFIYFGHQKERFAELFSAFGVVIRRIDNGR